MKEKLWYRVWKSALQGVTSSRGATQLDRLEAVDWDVLVILDACRADVLAALADWPVDSTVSPAGCTSEWLGCVAARGVFDDAHVITGNPQYDKISAELNCDTLERYWDSRWDNSLQTVPPEPILDRTAELFESRDQRIVAHVEQPHWPYIAKLGESWELAYQDLGPWGPESTSEKSPSLQVAMQGGYIDIKRAYSAYRASVASVWSTLTEYVQNWYSAGGTVVVTADHGETFGRLRDLHLYEHPCSCHVGPIVTVPWVEFTPQETPEDENGIAKEKLEALGYVQ